MFLGKVIGDVKSNEVSAEGNQRFKMVQKLDLYRNPSGPSTIAADLIGAGDGDIVIVGRPSPGTLGSSTNTIVSSGSAMIMGILDNSDSTAKERESAELAPL